MTEHLDKVRARLAGLEREPGAFGAYWRAHPAEALARAEAIARMDEQHEQRELYRAWIADAIWGTD